MKIELKPVERVPIAVGDHVRILSLRKDDAKYERLGEILQGATGTVTHYRSAHTNEYHAMSVSLNDPTLADSIGGSWHVFYAVEVVKL